MLLSLLACKTQLLEPSDTGGHDSIPGTDDSATGSKDDSGSGSGSGKDDSGTDDSATDDSGSDDSGKTDTGPKPWLVPDFALVDLNTSSPTYGHTISPRDYKKRISGWYFIHAD
jgi:hypothetical protein